MPDYRRTGHVHAGATNVPSPLNWKRPMTVVSPDGVFDVEIHPGFRQPAEEDTDHYGQVASGSVVVLPGNCF